MFCSESLFSITPRPLSPIHLPLPPARGARSAKTAGNIHFLGSPDTLVGNGVGLRGRRRKRNCDVAVCPVHFFPSPAAVCAAGKGALDIAAGRFNRTTRQRR